MNDTLERLCPECGTAYKGRIDKKFCSDQCRSSHNNRMSNATSDYVRRINMILRKNRCILEKTISNGRSTVLRELLRIHGFDFNYFTGTHNTSAGSCRFYCYDHGYEEIDAETVFIFRKEF